MAKAKLKASEERLSLHVGAENKKLIRQAAEKDDRAMNKWATRVLRDAALAALKK